MRIGDIAWCKLILSAADEMGVALTRDHLRAFAELGRELIKWNRKVNLTAITKPVEVATKHFVDSLAPLADIPECARVLDMGCGAGFPGLPVKIVRPDLELTLIDSVRKKISFVKTMIRTLNLGGITAFDVRAEDFCRKSDQAQAYQVVTCRALANSAQTVAWGLPFLAPGGMILLLKTPLEQKEAGPLYNLAREQNLKVDQKPYLLPKTDHKRVLIKIERL